MRASQSLASAVMLLGLSSASAAAGTTGITPGVAWPLMSASYTWTAPQRCMNAQTAKLRPNEAVYRVCEDQMALFHAALRDAAAAKKLLVVEFGATWCPSCRSVQAQFKSGELADLSRFHVVDIAVSTVVDGRVTEVPSGKAVLDAVLAYRPEVKLRAVPFLAVIDPAQPGRTAARNMDDFESLRSGQHIPERVSAYINAAARAIETGAPPPSEPGYIRKKIIRLWNRVMGL